MQEFKNLQSEWNRTDEQTALLFSLVIEASKRTLNKEHYDSQILAAIVMTKQNIAEMKTGEGKTLSSALAIIYFAMDKKGVHVFTANEYLAQRDHHDLSPLYSFFELTSACLQTEMSHEAKSKAYLSDITYSNSSQIAFDYLADNMVSSPSDCVQRGFHAAIIDEIDSILIDEARTPLIISQPSNHIPTESLNLADAIAKIIISDPKNFTLDEKLRLVSITEEGWTAAEPHLQKSGHENIFAEDDLQTLHFINQAVTAHLLYKNGKDYIVHDDQIFLVDLNTGRVTPDRRFSDGLHQSLETKERTTVKPEFITAASITFQSFFKFYDYKAGMTGTAQSDQDEFINTYDMPVVQIPTHKPMIRKDHHDQIFFSDEHKYEAIVDQIIKCVKRNQPVLVGTTSVEKSEILGQILTGIGVTHTVLNAKNHHRESIIIAQAGIPSNVTISTNMAGRGTDIKLGGNPDIVIANSHIPNIENETIRKNEEEKIRAQFRQAEIAARNAGGLFVIGTERHDSRRIDDQLIGRSGRQGDPGETRFFISLDDDLARLFAGDSIRRYWSKFNLSKTEPIDHPIVTNSIAKAQKKSKHIIQTHAPIS